MTRIYLTFLLMFAYLGYAQDCGGRYTSEIFSGVSKTTVQFGSALNSSGSMQDLYMDIYQPQGDTATNRPVIIFCFGGSFVGGVRTSGELVSLSNSFAKRGYVCASIDYRIASSVFEMASEESMVKIVFSAVQDGKAAIRYFKKNYDEGNSLGINDEQIFIGGTSAGGILAVNLTYVDTLAKLPLQWQEWATEIGGLEGGNDGSPGYCSYPNGVFSFAGAVGDTAYINANDVPFYSCHSVNDGTVPYGFGTPLNGLAPVDLYGSGAMETRLTNLGVYNWIDTYQGSSHPPFSSSNAILDTTDAHLTTFLYNILDCNPNNFKHNDQQNCTSFFNDTTISGITSVVKATNWSVYPNPAVNQISLKGLSGYNSMQIVNTLGTVLYNSKIALNENDKTIDVSHFAPGVYYVELKKSNKIEYNTFVIK